MDKNAKLLSLALVLTLSCKPTVAPMSAPPPTTGLYTTVASGGSIADAIRAAGAGGVVELGCGKYPYSSAIYPLAGQTIRSAGCAVMVKGGNSFAVDINGVPDVTIEGIGFDGQYNQTANSGYTSGGIYVHGNPARTTIRRCRLVNHETAGIVGTGTTGITIEGNYLEGNAGDGTPGAPSVFLNQNTYFARISDNTVAMRKGGSHGIAIHTESASATIHDSIISGNRVINGGGGYCIEVGSFAGGGTPAQRPANAIVANNTCYQTAAGASGGYSFDYVFNSQISNNVYQVIPGLTPPTANAAIESVNGSNVVISNNVLDGGGSAAIGIALDHEMSHTIVSGNVIRNMLTSNQGIYIAARSNASYCVSNKCAIDNNVIKGNVLEVPAGANSTGIRLHFPSPDTARNNLIIDNMIGWMGPGGGNSTGIAVGGTSANVTGTMIRGNLLRGVAYGYYGDGAPTDQTSLVLNDFIGVATPIKNDNPVSSSALRVLREGAKITGM